MDAKKIEVRQAVDDYIAEIGAIVSENVADEEVESIMLNGMTSRAMYGRMLKMPVQNDVEFCVTEDAANSISLGGMIAISDECGTYCGTVMKIQPIDGSIKVTARCYMNIYGMPVKYNCGV